MQRVSVGVVVIAAIGDQNRKTTPRSAGSASNGRDSIDQGQQLGDVVAVSTGEGDRQRYARPITNDGGVWNRLWRGPPATGPWHLPFSHLHVEGIYDYPRPIDGSNGIQASQHRLMQPVKHPFFLPVPQPPPTRHTTTKPQLRGMKNDIASCGVDELSPPDKNSSRRATVDGIHTFSFHL